MGIVQVNHRTQYGNEKLMVNVLNGPENNVKIYISGPKCLI